jgi:hypothetical protein
MAKPSTQITVATVNKYLKAAGHDERLTRGKGYFYFRDGDTGYWPATSVYVYDLNALSVGDWLAERDELASHSWKA